MLQPTFLNYLYVSQQPQKLIRVVGFLYRNRFGDSPIYRPISSLGYRPHGPTVLGTSSDGSQNQQMMLTLADQVSSLYCITFYTQVRYVYERNERMFEVLIGCIFLIEHKRKKTKKIPNGKSVRAGTMVAVSGNALK